MPELVEMSLEELQHNFMNLEVAHAISTDSIGDSLKVLEREIESLIDQFGWNAVSKLEYEINLIKGWHEGMVEASRYYSEGQKRLIKGRRCAS